MTSTVVQAAIWLLAGGALFVFLRKRKTRKQN
jgi:LPXTG-motif cell wall-anchored protein